jgi:DNA-binding transcriptional LysR family regulator
MIAQAFKQQTIRIVASPKLGLKSRVSLSDLAAYPWVLSQNGCGMRSTLRHAIEGQGMHFNVGVEAFGAELQLSLVSRGAGVGLVTPDALAASRHRDELKVLSVKDFKTDVISWLVHRPLPNRLQKPVQLLLTELRRG